MNITCMERAAREVLAATTFLVAYDGRRPALAAKVEVGAAVGAAPLDALVVTLDERRPEERSELIVPPTVSPVPPERPAPSEPDAIPPTSPSACSSPRVVMTRR